MKKVMVGVFIAAVVGGAGAGTAAAVQPSDPPARQDCRTYSSVTECGQPQLTEKQRQCVSTAVQQGMTERRAAVECRGLG